MLAPASTPAPRTAPRPAAVIGAAAARALSPGARGTVIAVFRRSVYLSGVDDRLACLGPMELGAGPLNLLVPLPADVDLPAAGVRVGDVARITADALHLADRFVIPLAQAKHWQPAPVPNEWHPGLLSNNLDALARVAAPPCEGLAPWVPALATDAPLADRDDPLLRTAKPAVTTLRAWLRDAVASTADVPPVPNRVAGLIGLGPGLTPSGDDLVGGTLIALRALSRDAGADRLADWALDHARDGTGRISQAHLTAATEGQGAAALHDALAALCTSGAPGLTRALRALDAIGHSSGWDALAGAVLAAAAISSSAAD